MLKNIRKSITTPLDLFMFLFGLMIVAMIVLSIVGLFFEIWEAIQ